MSDIKKFKDQEGYIYAYGAVPDNYLIGSIISK